MIKELPGSIISAPPKTEWRWDLKVYRRGTKDVVHSETFEATPLEAERRQAANWTRPYAATPGLYRSVLTLRLTGETWLTIE